MSKIIKTNYGQYTDDKCQNCFESNTFMLTKETELRTFLSANFGIKQKKYYKACLGCMNTQQIDEYEAEKIIESNFSKKEIKLKRKHILSVAASFIACAVIIAIIFITIFGSDRIAIKLALSSEPDGIYHVYNKNSVYLATVSVNGSDKNYDMFAKYELYSADDYTDIDEDQVEISYYYENEGKLEMCIYSDSSVLIDERKVYLQYCYYDPELNQQFYYWGISGSDDINYISEKSAIYNFEYYASEDEMIYYTMYYFKTDGYWAELYYIDDDSEFTLDSINIYYLNDSTVNRIEYYDFSNKDEFDIDGSSLLTEYIDILTILNELGLSPDISIDYEFYLDTSIVQSTYVEEMIDDELVCSAYENEIRTVGKYYILIESGQIEN